MRQHRIRIATYGIALAAFASLAAACGGGSSGGGNASGGQTVAQASGGSGGSLSTHSTSLGMVLADAQGRTVYELVGDTASNPKCDGNCQSIWPPVTSGGAIKVMAGHPLFTYTGDTGAGQTNGNKVTDEWGLWLALSPNGSPVTATGSGSTGGGAAPTATPSQTSSSSSGGGGYGY
jgi:predicted lipoprotein with Yx(FWY)xxD motif